MDHEFYKKMSERLEKNRRETEKLFAALYKDLGEFRQRMDDGFSNIQKSLKELRLAFDAYASKNK